jgi:2-keto-4-pentenoate hydratase/2-oxohepta-3-ene-1,7-dioic acid hydratase in catechol pathway
MKLVSFRSRPAFGEEPGRGDRLGIAEAGRVVPAASLGEGMPGTMAELLARWPDNVTKLRSAWDAMARSDGAARAALDRDDIELLAPVPRPGKIAAAGVNYRSHGAEQNKEAPDHPVLFAKFSSSVIGPGQAIRWSPQLTQAVDFEAELAVVIGRTARRVEAADALEYVAGYTCLNDVSARDLQYSDRQFVRAKSLDTFCPMGPWLVTADEVPDPQGLRIQCLVNGDLMQDASTSDMVFSVAALVSFCSHAFTLEPGDVIATGTPAGVGWFREPRRMLSDGDVVEVRIERVGSLVNPCREEPRGSGS